MGFEDVDWTDVAQYTDRWPAVMNTVMDIRIP
jgi:hypothetical protein